MSQKFVDLQSAPNSPMQAADANAKRALSNSGDAAVVDMGCSRRERSHRQDDQRPSAVLCALEWAQASPAHARLASERFLLR